MLRGRKNLTIIFLVLSNLKTEKYNFERDKVVLVISRLEIKAVCHEILPGDYCPGFIAFSRVYETVYCFLLHIL